MPREFLSVAHLNRRLFGGVLAIMFLYPDAKEWNREVLQKINDLLNFYSGKGIYLSRLGFPRDDWKDWLKKE